GVGRRHRRRSGRVFSARACVGYDCGDERPRDLARRARRDRANHGEVGMTDLHWMTATQLISAYRTKDLSPVEVAEYLLGRIEALDAKINAICFIDQETTLAQARASEERWMNGEPQGLLEGVPVAIKDLVLSKGWPTLRGSKTVDAKQPWDH